MRPFKRPSPQAVQDSVARKVLEDVIDWVIDVEPALTRIARGEQPDSTGGPTVPPPVDLSDYFKLSGRPRPANFSPNQTAYGGSDNHYNGLVLRRTAALPANDPTNPSVIFGSTSAQGFNIITEEFRIAHPACLNDPSDENYLSASQPSLEISFTGAGTTTNYGFLGFAPGIVNFQGPRATVTSLGGSVGNWAIFEVHPFPSNDWVVAQFSGIDTQAVDIVQIRKGVSGIAANQLRAAFDLEGALDMNRFGLMPAATNIVNIKGSASHTGSWVRFVDSSDVVRGGAIWGSNVTTGGMRIVGSATTVPGLRLWGQDSATTAAKIHVGTAGSIGDVDFYAGGFQFFDQANNSGATAIFDIDGASGQARVTTRGWFEVKTQSSIGGTYATLISNETIGGGSAPPNLALRRGRTGGGSVQTTDLMQLLKASAEASSGTPLAGFTADGNYYLAIGAAAGSVYTSNASGIGSWAAPAAGTTEFADNVFRVIGSVTASKKLAFEVDGFTAATTRTLTPQNADYTIAGTNLAQTFSAAQTVAIAGGSGVALTLSGDDASVSDIIRMYAGSASGSVLVFTVDPVGAFNVASMKLWPSGVGVGSASASFDPGPVTSAITLALPDLTGRLLTAVPSSTVLAKTKGVVVGADPPAVASGDLGKVDLTGQGADIAAVNLSNVPPSGIYRVTVYVITTTAGTGAGTLAVTIGYNDGAARVATPTGGTGNLALHPLNATGFSSGSVYLRRGSGEITYATAATGGYGAAPAAVYSIYVRVEFLG